ncbi:MAG: HigA family addiction module antidote protein [Sphingomonas bacterium]|nr:HigA family addiction module antidote protein [Sphingomonas bacterium]
MSYTGKLLPPHPGSLLRKMLNQFGCTKTVAARFLGLSRQTIYQIAAEKQAITPSVALRVAKMTGTRAEMWLGLQQAYDLAVARVHCRNWLKKVPKLEERW